MNACCWTDWEQRRHHIHSAFPAHRNLQKSGSSSSPWLIIYSEKTVPVIRVRRGLAPPRDCALPARHQKKGAVPKGIAPYLFHRKNITF